MSSYNIDTPIKYEGCDVLSVGNYYFPIPYSGASQQQGFELFYYEPTKSINMNCVANVPNFFAGEVYITAEYTKNTN